MQRGEFLGLQIFTHNFNYLKRILPIHPGFYLIGVAMIEKCLLTNYKHLVFQIELSHVIVPACLSRQYFGDCPAPPGVMASLSRVNKHLSL
jgi:hypothetical protein